MSPVLTRHAPEPVLRLRSIAIPLAALVVFAALFAGVLRLVEQPPTVDAVTIENRTGYDLEVAVADGPDRSQVLLAGVGPATTTRVEEVLDQGSSWHFLVQRAGRTVGTLERSQERLRDDGWRVVVPASWDDRVREAATG